MSKIDRFEISANILCDTYEIHKEMNARRRLATLLSFMHLWKPTKDLYDDLLNRHPEIESWRDRLPDDETEKIREMVKQIYNYGWDTIDPVPNQENSFERINNYFFFGKEEGYIQEPFMGVILNQKVEIELQKFPDDYRFFFAYIFSKTVFPIEFLSYHFEKTFNRNISAYKDFLFIVQKENAELINNGKRIWDKWIEEVPPRKKLSKEAINFRELFRHNVKYHNYVIDKLSSEDMRWFDQEGNFIRVKNDNPSAVCDLLRLLTDFGYLDIERGKDVIKRMSYYALQCFNVKVGEKSRNTTHRGNLYTQLSRKIEKATRV